MISDDRPDQNSERNFRTLGICWIVYGIVRIVAAIWLVSFSSTATVMFGALLNRVADPFAMMSDFHILYTVTIALSAVCGVLGILGGLVLALGQRSGFGRNLTLIAAFLSLCDIPLGITLGIYTLIVLLPVRVTRATSVAVPDRTSFSRHASAT